MEIKNDEVVEETEDEIADDEIVEDEKKDDEVKDDEVEEDTTDWKSKFEEEKGRRKRVETKLSKANPKTKPPSKSGELDYGQKAFLVANGVKGSKETELVKNIMSDTGKTLEDVMESKYFKAELEEIRELKTTEDALPKGSKRTGQSGQDSVEYWLAKGELPTDRDLRQKVVNARIEKEKNKNVFE